MATPRHNWAMPYVPSNQNDYFDLGEHYMAQPAYKPQLETLSQAAALSQHPLTPPRIPTKPQHTVTPPSQASHRRPQKRCRAVENAPLTPPKSPLQLLSPTFYITPSSSKITSPTKTASSLMAGAAPSAVPLVLRHCASTLTTFHLQLNNLANFISINHSNAK